MVVANSKFLMLLLRYEGSSFDWIYFTETNEKSQVDAHSCAFVTNTCVSA